MLRATKTHNAVVSAVCARANFGKLLRQVEENDRSWVIEHRGTPRAILLSIQQYVRLAAPEPDVLKTIGESSKRKGTDAVTSRQIDKLIKKARLPTTKR